MLITYREYKSDSDDYQNNLKCVYLSELGLAGTDSKASEKPVFHAYRNTKEVEESIEIATFKVGEKWFAFPSHAVVEAIIPKGIARLPRESNGMLGSMLHKGQAIPILDLEPLLNLKPRDPLAPEYSQVLLIQTHRMGCPIGILVDDLGEIPNIPCSEIQSMTGLTADTGLIKGIVKTPNELLSLLAAEDYERLFTHHTI